MAVIAPQLEGMSTFAKSEMPGAKRVQRAYGRPAAAEEMSARAAAHHAGRQRNPLFENSVGGWRSSGN